MGGGHAYVTSTGTWDLNKAGMGHTEISVCDGGGGVGTTFEKKTCSKILHLALSDKERRQSVRRARQNCQNAAAPEQQAIAPQQRVVQQRT